MTTAGRDIYARDARIRKAVTEQLDGVFERAMDYFDRALASLVGLKAFRDWTPTERWAVYTVNPPFMGDIALLVQMSPEQFEVYLSLHAAELVPPQDVEGVYPMWMALATEDPAFYDWACRDYIKLAKERLP